MLPIHTEDLGTEEKMAGRVWSGIRSKRIEKELFRFDNSFYGYYKCLVVGLQKLFNLAEGGLIFCIFFDVAPKLGCLLPPQAPGILPIEYFLGCSP